MSRRIHAELERRLNALGFSTKCERSTVKGEWMKYPTVEYRWFLVDPLGNPIDGPVFRCHRTALPTSTKSPKAKELRKWARDCLILANKMKRIEK